MARSADPLRRRLGIRATLFLGLSALLLVAGAVSALLVLGLVRAEAGRQLESQQRRRAELMARALALPCATGGHCGPAVKALAAPGEGQDVVGLAVVGPGALILGGDGAYARGPVVADALQSRTLAWRRVAVEGPARQEVAVPFELADGRRAVLASVFDLAGPDAEVARQQRLTLWLLIADFVGVLLFGIYLGGRVLVAPLRALTAAAERVIAGDLDPEVVPEEAGAAEIAVLTATLKAMLSRLQAQRDELAARLSELESTRGELVRSEKLATVGRLASGVAHEVGNPLAAVIGYVEFMQDPRGVPADQQADLLSRMATELARIQDTIRDLLDFSRPASGSPEVVDAAQVAQGALDLVRYQQRFKGIALGLESQEGLTVRVHPERLRQVLVNLLMNAADACGEVEEPRIEVAVSEEGDGVRLSVTDNGPGVPAEMRERLFDPFVSTKGAGAGTGLGLAISQRIMEEAGGRLELASGAGEGAEFVAWLPGAAGEAPD